MESQDRNYDPTELRLKPRVNERRAQHAWIGLRSLLDVTVSLHDGKGNAMQSCIDCMFGLCQLP